MRLGMKQHTCACHLALGVLGALVIGCESGRNQYAPPPPPTVTVSPPVQRKVTEYLEYTGTTAPVATVEIRARVGGFLERVEFEEGDVVAEDALLYVIDQREYAQTVARSKAALAGAQAGLKLAEATLKSMEESFTKNIASELEVLNSRAERDAAAALVDEAQAELAKANLDLQYTEIRAPLASDATWSIPATSSAPVKTLCSRRSSRRRSMRCSSRSAPWVRIRAAATSSLSMMRTRSNIAG